MIDFSVLIAVYNGESPTNFSTALASIVEQTLPPTEVVLVKDGPLKRDLENVIATYTKQYPYFKIVGLDENRGLGEALRRGLEVCSFDIVLRMDSDDICCKNRFEVQVSYLEKNRNVAVLGANVEEFTFVPGDTGRVRRVPTLPDQIRFYSQFRCPINHPTAAFRKDAVLSVGSYKPMPLFEDYYLWLRLLKEGFLMQNLPDKLLYFRVTKETMKRRQGLAYLKKELHFINTLKNERLIGLFHCIAMIIVRLPVRLLPKRICLFVYNHFLRS